MANQNLSAASNSDCTAAIHARHDASSGASPAPRTAAAAGSSAESAPNTSRACSVRRAASARRSAPAFGTRAAAVASISSTHRAREPRGLECRHARPDAARVLREFSRGDQRTEHGGMLRPSERAGRGEAAQRARELGQRVAGRHVARVVRHRLRSDSRLRARVRTAPPAAPAIRSAARNPEAVPSVKPARGQFRRGDRGFDRGWFAFDFHERVHARIRLDTHGGPMDLKLDDAAIDFADHDVAEPFEQFRECPCVADRGADFFPNFVPACIRSGALPVERRNRAVRAAELADAQHMIPGEQRRSTVS